MTTENISNYCCGCKEEVAFKLYKEVKTARGYDIRHPTEQGTINRKSNTKEIQEQDIRLFAIILSVVKGETKEGDVKLPDLHW